MKKSTKVKPGKIKPASPAAVKTLDREEQLVGAVLLIAKSLDRMATAMESDIKLREEQNTKTQRMIDELMPMMRKTLDGAARQASAYDGN